MPFLIPALPAIAGAAGSIFGGLLSKKGNLGGTSPQQNALNEQQLANLKLGKDWATNLFPQGQNLLDLSRSTYQVPLNYWTGIAGGNRNAATSMLAPEIQRIQEGEQTSQQAASNIFSRSGGSSTYMLDSMFAPQRAITSLLQTARPDAMKNLSDLAGRFANTGEGLTRDASSLLSGVTSGTSSMSRTLMEQEEMRRAAQEKMGKSIGGLLADIVRGITSGGKKKSTIGGWVGDAGTREGLS